MAKNSYTFVTDDPIVAQNILSLMSGKTIAPSAPAGAPAAPPPPPAAVAPPPPAAVAPPPPVAAVAPPPPPAATPPSTGAVSPGGNTIETLRAAIQAHLAAHKLPSLKRIVSYYTSDNSLAAEKVPLDKMDECINRLNAGAA